MADSQLVPPSDLDAEAAVISAVLLDTPAFDKVAGILTPEKFYSEAHRRIFEACEDLSANGKPLDVVQVAGWLRDRGRLAQVGGMAYLTEVLNAAPAVTNVEAYALRVAQKHQLRKLISVCNSVSAAAYAGVVDVGAFIDASEQAIYDVSRGATDRPRLEPLKAVVDGEFQKWLTHYNRIKSGEIGPDSVDGIPTGFEVIDDALCGLHDGEVTIIAARPGMGKSALAAQIAQWVGTLPSHGAAFFSLEMPKEQLADRAICVGAGVELRKARTGAFDPRDWGKLTEAASALSLLDRLLVNDTPSLTLSAIRAMTREAAADMARIPHPPNEEGVRLRLVVVDYLQLVEGEDAATRELAVASVSRGLKRLAKEMRVAVVALAQLNRSVESRTDKRPGLADLRESGAIEQDADNVLFIYRDDYYDKESKEKGIAEIIIGKQRNGPQGTVKLAWDGEYTRFRNLPPVDYGHE